MKSISGKKLCKVVEKLGWELKRIRAASWSHQPNTPKIALGITTNGIVKSNGLAVMGAGVAKAFARRYPRLPAILDYKLIESGNKVHYLLNLGNIDIFSFPTKHPLARSFRLNFDYHFCSNS